MKLLQISIKCCLLICVVFSLSSCSLLDSTKETPKPDDLQTTRNTAADKVAGLEKDVKKKEADEKKEKADCTTMQDQSKKSGKDPNDVNSNTYKQCEIAKKAENDLKELNANLTTARAELKELDIKIEKTKEESQNSGGLTAWLFPVLIGFLSLLVLAGLVTLVLLFRSSWQKFRAETDSRLNGLEIKNRQYSEENRQLKKSVEVLSNQIVEQKKSFNNLAQRLSERTQNSAPPPVNFAPQLPREEPIFPISSENYQNRFGANASSATVDPLTGFLIEDPGKGDEFLLVRDNALGGEQRYVVPNIRRFSTKNDYLNYYQNFYACENPSGGTVWIKSPTVVRRVSDGWQLEVMGELEIRM